MNAVEAHRTATIAAAATTVIGAVLVAAPRRVGALIGLEAPTALRVVGASDLALVPGLIAGAPRWPWMVARAVGNLAIAGYLQRAAAAQGTWKPLPIAAGLVTLTTVDGRAALALKRSA